MLLRKLDISTSKIEWDETLKENEKILKQEEADFNRTILEVNNEINALQSNMINLQGKIATEQDKNNDVHRSGVIDSIQNKKSEEVKELTKKLVEIKKEIKTGVETKYNHLCEMTNSEIILQKEGAIIKQGSKVTKLTL
jgi:predicted  nucleic acid-binding Zn-ribbon protein